MYLLIAEWDENNRPTKYNVAANQQERDEKFSKMIEFYPSSFVVEMQSIELQYMTVDPINKTVSFDDVQKRLDDLLPYLAGYRYGIETGGITFNSVSIKTDRESRANLIAARILAKEDVNYTVKWKTENGFAELDAAAVLAVAQAVSDHVQKCFDVEADVAAQIEAGTLTDTDAVKAAFDTGMAA